MAQKSISTNYYPFGMQMPGKTFSSGEYRFGFNGKEMDNEVSGQGNQYDYGFRIYNPRLGRFLSVDPLTKSYPWYTPYQFAGNKPIWAIDLDGLEEKKVTGENTFEIHATYVAEQKVVDNVDLELITLLVNELYNMNPRNDPADVILKSLKAELPNIMADDDGPGTLQVTFVINIVPQIPEDSDPNNLRKSRVWTKSGKSKGGFIVMGQEGAKIFKTRSDGSTTAAHFDGYSNTLTLNPAYFDNGAKSYHGFGMVVSYEGETKVETTYWGSAAGTFAHEIGHDLILTHEKGVYPKSGTMSTKGGPPTNSEMNQIIDSKNERVLPPNHDY